MLSDQKPKLVIIAACLALSMALIGSVLVFAQSSNGCPSGSDCIDASDFDSGLNGWTPGANGITVTQSSSHGIWFDNAYGVLKVSGTASSNLKPINKQLYLDVGRYVLSLRAGEDFSLGHATQFWVNFSGVAIGYGGCFGALSSTQYNVLTSCIIEVTTPGPASLQISTDAVTYYDYIYLEKVSSAAPTPTMNTNFPTLTPRPGTPIPPDMMATPQPTAAPYCVERPVVPSVPQFQATPTAVPDGTNWEILDTFLLFHVNSAWKAAGGDINISDAVDHTGDGSRSAFIAYDGIPQTSGTVSDLNEGLILERSFTSPFWVNGWAQADSVPAGATGYIELWAYSSSTWTRVNQFPISARRWYPFHAQISGSVSALAFVATRSDDPSRGSGGVYLDDVYVYGNLDLAPYCDGKYPDGVSDVNGFVVADAGSDTLSIPSDKPCPGSIDRPNNFWGYLLSGLTFFMDQVMAEAPYHNAGQLQMLMQTIVFSPLLGMFTFLSILFDWTIPLWVLGIMVGLWVIYSLLLAWKFARRATVE